MRAFVQEWYNQEAESVIWFREESPAVFELFVLWLYQQSQGLKGLVDEVTALVSERDNPGGARAVPSTFHEISLYRGLASLHVFAAKFGIEELQDTALDVLQDVFLRCEWHATPKFVKFVYDKCDPDYGFRLREWAVAMMAWTLATRDVDLVSLCPGTMDGDGNVIFPTGPSGPTALSSEMRSNEYSHHSVPPAPLPLVARRFCDLLIRIPDLLEDYCDHVSKLSKLKSSAAMKNPCLRLPSNALNSKERRYGFRMCSFHSHRRQVGQGLCPHQSMLRNVVAVRRHFQAPSTAFDSSTAPAEGSTHGGSGLKFRKRSEHAESSDPDSSNSFSSAGTRAVSSNVLKSSEPVCEASSDSRS